MFINGLNKHWYQIRKYVSLVIFGNVGYEPQKDERYQNIDNIRTRFLWSSKQIADIRVIDRGRHLPETKKHKCIRTLQKVKKNNSNRRFLD